MRGFPWEAGAGAGVGSARAGAGLKADGAVTPRPPARGRRAAFRYDGCEAWDQCYTCVIQGLGAARRVARVTAGRRRGTTIR
ncbi:hypothetical protein MTP03_01620 [Tsukamurella sp. PLM1]|nr:hypothetical protein MTP03_01620 [Tsukamurella sp. PLM1]